jgi:hypothetical protein
LGENPDHEFRLFAVKGPELPLDITSELIGNWARESGKDVSKARTTASLIGGKRTDEGNLEFYVEFSEGVGPGTNVPVNWNQISNMMHDVKSHGTEGKDRKFGRYLTEEPEREPGSPH